MVLKGHVDKGVIVLDEDASLPEGTTVFISLQPQDEDKLPYRKYRGKPYTYEAPFEPVSDADDWDAAADTEETP